jgi:hypothetical protein
VGDDALEAHSLDDLLGPQGAAQHLHQAQANHLVIVSDQHSTLKFVLRPPPHGFHSLLLRQSALCPRFRQSQQIKQCKMQCAEKIDRRRVMNSPFGVPAYLL